MILTILRMILLCASVYGYTRYFSRRLAPELSIGLVFALIGSVIFLAGLLNVLPEAAALICAGGLVCLVRAVVKRELKPQISLGGIFFVLVCIALALLLKGEKLIYIDNFTHWETAVRHLLATDRFPNFQDSYIRFQSYPLGTASLIYYFARVSGIESEWFQMLVHWACAAAMLSGLFCLAKNLPARIACFAGALLLLCADNAFTQLLVDSTLGYVALGALAFCVYYREELRERALWVLPWLIYLIAVKNSGALFVIYVVVLVFLWGGWKRGLQVGVGAMSTLLLWNRHVSYAFEAGMLAQHAMSIEHFKRMLAMKKPGSVGKIVDKMVHQVFSLSNAYLPVLVLSVLLLALSLVWLRRDKAVRLLLIYGAVCYLIYQAGMLGMYVFTMQEKEAMRLASYDRYHGTIWIFAAGVALIAALLMSDRLTDRSRGRLWTGAVCGACVVAMAVSGMPNYSYYTRYKDEDTLSVLAIRERADALIAENALPEGERYYLLVDDDFTAAESAYLYNLVNCLMLADDVQVSTLNQIFNPAEIERCDYLVAFGTSPAIGDYVYDHYGSKDVVVRMAEDGEKPDFAAGFALGN